MPAPRTLQVLLIEDEPGDARLLALAMKKFDYPIELHCVEDGQEGLDFLHRSGSLYRAAPRPDLILLDLKMPGMSGLETLHAIKQAEAQRAIPVVVITTSGLESDVATAYRLGAAGYVLKPADLNAFIAAIDTLCAYWCKLVRLPEKME